RPLGDGRSAGTTTEGPWLPEGPVDVAEQHLDALDPGQRQVGHPIAIEVAHGQDKAARPEVPGRLEGPIASAEQYRDTVARGHRQVGHPIAVEVAHGHGPRAISDREGPGRLEGPVAVAKEYRDAAGPGSPVCVRHGQVEHPIAVEVADGHGPRVR